MQNRESEKKEAVYHRVTMESLADLYWRLGALDIEKDEHIDSYVSIRDCDKYTQFYHNQFEWMSIRDIARETLKTDKETYPVHFQYALPIKLSNYNFGSGTFNIVDEYKIDYISRFEVLAENIYVSDCTMHQSIPNYPRGLELRLDLPFRLVHFPVDPRIASAYIAEKTVLQKEVNENRKRKVPLDKFRTAYLVLKFRVDEFKEIRRLKSDLHLAAVRGDIEGYEVYTDKDRTVLMFSEDFRGKQRWKRSKYYRAPND